MTILLVDRPRHRRSLPPSQLPYVLKKTACSRRVRSSLRHVTHTPRGSCRVAASAVQAQQCALPMVH
eukprot:2118727-Prymnesium_polylepis.1